ncbi:MAG: hypothetical protein A2498_10680 [Lentisphaerae bacterium RIFOXYC12_FULL_60_16]|nr:MAG: hypothetical protein A2498_10680 [Lentisphaerae bacterium RIFOXYC12_FULL_60_16]
MIRQAFRTSFAVMRDQWVTLLLILGFTYWPLGFLKAYLMDSAYEPYELLSSLSATRFWAQFILIIPDAAILYVGLNHIAGEPAGFGESLGYGFLNYGRMWITRFFNYLSWLTLLLLVVPGVYGLTRWSLSEITVVSDRTIGVGALHRSWQMTRGRVGQIFFALCIGGGTYAVLWGAITALYIRDFEVNWWAIDGLCFMGTSVLNMAWLLYLCGIYAQLEKP